MGDGAERREKGERRAKDTDLASNRVEGGLDDAPPGVGVVCGGGVVFGHPIIEVIRQALGVKAVRKGHNGQVVRFLELTLTLVLRIIAWNTPAWEEANAGLAQPTRALAQPRQFNNRVRGQRSHGDRRARR